MTSAQERKIRQTGCDVRFDNLTRQLYATDASIYQIEPRGVAFPKNAEQASAVIRAAADAGVPVTPRGAGTSLVGNAIGEGLIVEFSRYNRQITGLDLEKRSVRVGAGVVLDQLNDFLKPHGFCFGPDVATSSRATIGGMIANDSSGARVPVYGTTADHVVSQELVMADGSIHQIGPAHESLRAQRDVIANLIGHKATWVTHDHLDEAGRDESRLDAPKSRPFVAYRTQGRGEAGRVHRRRRGPAGPTARLRRRAPVDHAAAQSRGLLLRARGR